MIDKNCIGFFFLGCGLALLVSAFEPTVEASEFYESKTQQYVQQIAKDIKDIKAVLITRAAECPR